LYTCTPVHFGKQIRNTWKVVKCGVGTGRRKSVGLTNGKVLKRVKEERNIMQLMKRGKTNLIGQHLE
jgi:hypothetical protein